MAHGKSEAFSEKLSEMDKRSLRDTESKVHREVDMAAEIHRQLTDSQKYALGLSNKLRKDGTRLALGDDLRHAEDKFEQALKTDEKAFGNGSSIVMEDCYALKMIYAGMNQKLNCAKMSFRIDEYLEATNPSQLEYMTRQALSNGKPAWNGIPFPQYGGYGFAGPAIPMQETMPRRYFYDGKVDFPPRLPYRQTDALYPYPSKK